MKIALAQINPTVGDLEGNAETILACVDRAKSAGARLAIFPEMSLLGYPPKDMLLKPSFIDRSLEVLEDVASRVRGIAAMVGCVQRNVLPRGRALHNSVAVLRDGRIASVHHKSLLPTYDVFDEHRYFEPGPMTTLARVADVRIGISVCEDLWTVQNVVGRVLYHHDPIAEMAREGAQLFVNAAASPFIIGKAETRSDLVSEHARRCQLPLIYVNQVGGNDELIFDGASCVYSATGQLVARAKSFEEDVLVVDLSDSQPARVERLPEGTESVYRALRLGLADYVRKCGFERGVVVGLSGGIDSSVVAALAASALGPQHVTGVLMPSRYSSPGSVEDAKTLAANLGIQHIVIPIDPMHRSFEHQLADAFAGREPDVTEENIQARTRGVILMAISNKFGSLVLSTGNKSEIAMGYCTLYGDMAGGLAVISDVPKQTVYELARYINRDGEIIPENVLTKAPSAELRADQTDQDSLPPYEVLDQILTLYIEQERSAEEIITEGFEPATVERVIVTVDRNEYKRKQAAVGLKVTGRAFGSGRRMPIAQRFQQTFNKAKRK